MKKEMDVETKCFAKKILLLCILLCQVNFVKTAQIVSPIVLYRDFSFIVRLRWQSNDFPEKAKFG